MLPIQRPQIHERGRPPPLLVVQVRVQARLAAQLLLLLLHRHVLVLELLLQRQLLLPVRQTAISVSADLGRHGRKPGRHRLAVLVHCRHAVSHNASPIKSAKPAA